MMLILVTWVSGEPPCILEDRFICFSVIFYRMLSGLSKHLSLYYIVFIDCTTPDAILPRMPPNGDDGMPRTMSYNRV